MPEPKNLDDLLRRAESEPRPVYLIQGDLVLAEPQAVRFASALAEKAGCEVERYRRPPTLAPILADLKTYSLFASAKVVLALDTAVLADAQDAAELIDQAAEVLPLPPEADAENDPSVREAASRLLQALRVFAIDPGKGAPEEVIDSLPKWAFEGGQTYRKKHKARKAKEKKALRESLGTLLEHALAAGLRGFAEGDLAELSDVVANGLPPGHSLILVESTVAKGHPVLASLKKAEAALKLHQVSFGRRGDWQGLEPLVEELARECGVRIAHDAVAELTRRTLRQTGDFRNRKVDDESMSRFASELRKLARLAQGGRITRQLVVQAVDDRGEQDVWQILDAIAKGGGGEALTLLRRYLAGAEDITAARLSFFAILARFCRQLVAVSGLVKLFEVPWGERNYNRFKNHLAPVLQGEPPYGINPLGGVHPFQLFRAYQTAGSMPQDVLGRLPSWVLETELQIKGDSSDADTALFVLVTRVGSLIR